MFVMHLALGGCLKAPPIPYGLTDDTGGHIAYILAAAVAQEARPEIDRVEIVTRRFDEPSLGPEYALAQERLGPKSAIRRIGDGNSSYLSKEALEAQIPAFTAAFLEDLARRDRRPDVIHAHFADAAQVALAARERFGIPVLYTPHSLGLDKLHALSRAPEGLRRRLAAETRAIATADAVIVSSRDEAERQVAGYDGAAPERVHCIAPGATLPEGPDMAAAHRLIASWLDAPEKPMVLAVARPVAKKNLPALVDIFAETPGLSDRANLVILAGLRRPGRDSSDEQKAQIAALEDAVARHGLQGRVALPPQHDGPALGALYRLAAAQGGVFANPALTEPFGLTILEAAEAGLPVVATCHGGPSDIVSRIGHGLLADPRNHAAFGAALLRLLSDGALHRRCAEAGRQGGSAYSWPAWAQRVTGVMRSLTLPRGVPLPARILASDIDNTLTGDRAALRRFADWHAELPTGRALFAVATGRSLAEARRILAEWEIPEPDAFITSCGTEIYRPGPDGRLAFDRDYADAIEVNWPRAALRELLDAPAIEMQPEIEQRPWKLACFGDARAAMRLRRRLDRAGLAAQVVASHGRLIDILPIAAGKGRAVAHLARCYGLGLAQCVAAGDSGNDECMLRVAGRAIVVGNADADLAELPPRAGLYRARAAHAAGLMEGLEWAGLHRAAAPDLPRARGAAPAPQTGEIAA